MFFYIKELASKIGVYMIHKFNDLLNEYDNYSFNKTELNNIQDHAYQIPIIEFYSYEYDINMVKSNNFFNHIYKNKIKTIFKVNGSYKLSQTQKYRFLDARHYCPANFNLDTYIKAYTGKCEKYGFPYEKLTSVEILKIKIKDLTYKYFNSSLVKHIYLDNHYRTLGDKLILFKKECKQNKLNTLMDL